jgi:hypothetical protein
MQFGIENVLPEMIAAFSAKKHGREKWKGIGFGQENEGPAEAKVEPPASNATKTSTIARETKNTPAVTVERTEDKKLDLNDSVDSADNSVDSRNLMSSLLDGDNSDDGSDLLKYLIEVTVDGKYPSNR